jgi:hypothetical protein
MTMAVHFVCPSTKIMTMRKDLLAQVLAMIDLLTVMRT